jgi:outer membrane protein W
MKTKKSLKNNLVLLLILGVMGTYAQNNNNVYNSDPIDIEGYVEEPPATDAELIQINSELKKQKTAIKVNKKKSKKYQELGRTTEKLADVTEEYINDKKDSEEVINNYNKKIDCLLKENQGPECDNYGRRKDTVRTRQAAPAAPTQVAVQKQPQEPGQFKIGLHAGAANYSGQVESLETESMLGAKVEFQLTDRFDMGFGFNYMQLDTRDYAQYFHSGLDYRYGYYDVYGRQGRNIEYTQWTIDAYGKFFIMKSDKVNPYIGAGLGYNRASLRSTENDNFWPGVQYNNYEFGDETYDVNWINAKLSVGSDFYFTENFGINVDLSYAKALGSVFGRERAFAPANAPDQERLEELSNDITNAHVFMGSLGVMFRF